VKVLSDNDVAEGYVRALRSTEGITVDRVVDRFGERVPDSELIAYAEEHDRVVFTGDQRFLYDDESGETPPPRIDADCSVIFYRQDRTPSVGAVVTSIQRIAEDYPDYRQIREYVPR
jgi:hypothetical protein